MLTCFTSSNNSVISIIPIVADEFNQWLENESTYVKNWLNTAKFTAKPESFCVIPDAQGGVEKVVIGLKDKKDFWSFGVLSTGLPIGNYQLMPRFAELDFTQVAIAWGLGAYQFTRYKKSTKTIAQLLVLATADLKTIENTINSIYLVRDLINTPTENMGPAELAAITNALAIEFNAKFSQLIGEDLLKNNYPTIYTVGRASHRAPRLLDLRWGNPTAPKVTLVGKGVCFDSGGLDLKTASGMALMKKDMGGAAHVLGLARMIMAAQLPICLRVLIPAVENSVAGNAYRPGDVITTRKGITVEIGNTDAEGRLVLCDALAEAVTENPALLIDMATLTGAARVATGTEVSALFTDDDTLANALMSAAQAEQDPIWRLPIYTPYRKLLDSQIADINNCGNSSYAGAITAALFLKEFVTPNLAWVHFDIMAWNVSARPGRPEGGEAMAIRALFNYLQKQFQ